MITRLGYPLLLSVLLLATGGSVSRLGASASSSDASRRLTILSVSDLKAKTSPCGCSIPKGGLGRLATMVDSLRQAAGPLLFVDAGGSFPDIPGRSDLPPFVLGSYAQLGLDALAIGPRDLQFGLAFLRSETRIAGTPITCANLHERSTGKLAFPANRLVVRDGIKIGIFALYGERLDLGPARDSLELRDPENAAIAMVKDLRSRGAQVIVLLAQLGRVGGEDLMSVVPGIDVAILGHDIPVYSEGRRVSQAIVVYAGDQGQHVGISTLQLTSAGSVEARDAVSTALGPEVVTQAAMQERVKAFEDAYNERMRVLQIREQALADADPDQDPVDHFVGGEVCARCHESEARQWATTAHSLAWETLVREKRDATPECITCHSVGYQKAGGFRDAIRTPQLVNVQCENCHGMGSLHGQEWYARNRVTEATCRSCHNAERDPGFDYAAKLPLMLHSNHSGESIRIIQARRAKASSGAPGK